MKVSVTQAAELTGYSVAKIKNDCANGALKAEKVGNYWVIDEKALNRWVKVQKQQPRQRFTRQK